MRRTTDMRWWWRTRRGAREDRGGARAAAVAALIGTLALGAAACGDDEDPAGPGDETGAVEAVVQDDPASTTPSLAPSAGGMALSLQGATFTGTVTGDFQAAISTDASTWVDLGSLNGITVNLQDGGQATVHGQQTVDAGTYSHVRLTVETGQVTLNAGSTVGGVVLTTDVVLAINGGSAVVVEREVSPFSVAADGTAVVAFELNSESWVDQTAIAAGTVTEAELEAAVTAAARLE